jgi:hypothetical protein
VSTYGPHLDTLRLDGGVLSALLPEPLKIQQLHAYLTLGQAYTDSFVTKVIR